jgi:alpha-L-fucosidase 2
MVGNNMNNKICFDKPANSWIEGLPLGNGKIGAMVMGYPFREKICFNHDEIWRKIFSREINPVSQYLPVVRKYLFDGDWEKAGHLLEEKLQPVIPGKQFASHEYQPACDLTIQMRTSHQAENYKRYLNLNDGIVGVEFDSGGVKFKRLSFVSAVDNIFVTRITSSQVGAISVDIGLEREDCHECVITQTSSGNILSLQGAIRNGTTFYMKVQAFLKGGHLVKTANSKVLQVENANEISIIVALQVNDKSFSLPENNFEKLLKRHKNEHKKIFNRSAFSLLTQQNNMTTDRLVHSAFIGKPEPHLYEMMFAMGRYLTIAASRPGSRAMHLQGIWNHELHPPWQSDYHLDTNLEMNYWLAEVAGLTEFTEPLFAMTESLVSDGEENAAKIYDCRGVLFPVAFAEEGKMLPGPWVAWTGAAGWLSQHFWQHYEFTLDQNFLKNSAYPFMKKVAEFYEDFLIRDSSGKLMFAPSMSPENVPAERGTWAGYKTVAVNATMDIAIARELFTNIIETSKILDCDHDKQVVWQQILNDLPDWPIDANGMLKEWARNENQDNPAHRHFSHLYPMFPGDLFSFEKTPELMEAAHKALLAREKMGFAENSGWSYAYLAILNARLGNGDKALNYLTLLAKSCMMDNLLTIHNDWRFQGLSLYWETGDRAFMIDAILAAAAAIAEMLIQSHNRQIRILPALPNSWNSGKVKGLRARGGFKIDIKWQKGFIENVKIYSLSGQPCSIKMCQPHKKLKLKCGERLIKAVQINDGFIQFDTEKEGIYEMNNK